MHEKFYAFCSLAYLLLLVCSSPAAAQASACSLQGQLHLQTACIIFVHASCSTHISKEHTKATHIFLTNSTIKYACAPEHRAQDQSSLNPKPGAKQMAHLTSDRNSSPMQMRRDSHWGSCRALSNSKGGRPPVQTVPQTASGTLWCYDSARAPVNDALLG